MTTPRVTALHVYPVKSVGGAAPGEAAVEPWGLAGDRRWMLVDETGRFLSQRDHPRLALARAEPLSGGGVRIGGADLQPITVDVPEPAGVRVVEVWQDKMEAVAAGPQAAEWFGTLLGTRATLVHLDDPAHRRPVDPRYGRPGETVSFADGYPLLVTTTASLHALNCAIAAGDFAAEGPLPMDRFRPSLVVTGTEPWAEDDWRRIRVGEVTFRVVKPCGRCVITTTDQHTALRGKEPLHTLARIRRFGGELVFGQNLIPETAGTVRLEDPFSVLE